MERLIYVMPGGEFRHEIESNARRGETTPERWLELAVSKFAEILRLLKEGRGFLAVGRGDRVMRLDDAAIERYREESPFRITPGMRPEDLGGYPAGTLIWKVPVEDGVGEKLMELSGAESPEEAVGYAIWRQSRFANALREDYSDWEPGIVLADDIFRSLTVPGAMKRLPGSRYEPVVPKNLPVGEAVRRWLRLLTGRDPAEVRLRADRKRDPMFRTGVLCCLLDGKSPEKSSVAAEVLELRPLVEIALFGPSPNEASRLVARKRDRGRLRRRREDEFVLIMPDLLSDPAPLAEMRGYLQKCCARALVASAGVIGCVHERAPIALCPSCPGWRAADGASRAR